MAVLDKIGEGFGNAALMAYQIWWALVLGFLISAIVQAWISPSRVRARFEGDDLRSLGAATALGAASSSCSYAAISIARSLFQKGASVATTLAFQFASTNLVWELGLALWILLGPIFTLAEFAGGLVLIGLMRLLLGVFVSSDAEREAREVAGEGDEDDGSDRDRRSIREQARSREGWERVARSFLNDWRMLWKEIVTGFLLAGFIGLLGPDFFSAVFVSDAPGALRTLENVIVGPLVAVASFVCSVGNVPLAAVLWANGISFSGVLAFIFADLIIVPIVLAYRKFYGTAFALRISGLMLATAILAALIIDLLFGGVGLIPESRPDTADVFGEFSVNYRFFLTLAGVAIFAAMVILRRGGPQGRRAVTA